MLVDEHCLIMSSLGYSYHQQKMNDQQVILQFLMDRGYLYSIKVACLPCQRPNQYCAWPTI